jgi:hypothetical protein
MCCLYNLPHVEIHILRSPLDPEYGCSFATRLTRITDLLCMFLNRICVYRLSYVSLFLQAFCRVVETGTHVSVCLAAEICGDSP